MDDYKLNLPEVIHFIGVGGIGMSALAQHLYRLGIKVSGSDLTDNGQTQQLLDLGIKVYLGHDVKNLPEGVGLIVKSLAIADDNAELLAAQKMGIKVLSYPELLGELTKNYLTIAVAGSHGKTTTTAMIAKMLIDADMDPTVILGSTADFLEGGNYRYGESSLLILEACEYYAGFLHLNPDITVIVNIEHDHFDAYPTAEDYLLAFKELINKTNPDYPVVFNMDFPLAQRLFEQFPAERFITFGKSTDNSLSDKDLKTELLVPGVHNRINALAAKAVGDLLDLEATTVEDSLAKFKGTARRLELRMERKGHKIYSDYAHHPTEIMASLQALRQLYPTQKLAVIYQAHQHHRTEKLLQGFAKSFDLADQIIIVPIYAARDSEELQANITADLLAEVVRQNKKQVQCVTEPAALMLLIDQLTEQNDVLVVMGAGDVEKLVGI